MVPKCLGALLVLFVTAQRFGEGGKPLHKRTANEGMVGITNSLQFGFMISCTTGLNPLEVILSYKSYGCYCGLGGSGTPVDATDTCCYKHDRCYSNSPCSNWHSVYFINYKWRKNSCATPQASINCNPASSYPGYYGFEKKCAAAVCNCDKKFAYCVQRNRDSYDKKYCSWDCSKC